MLEKLWNRVEQVQGSGKVQRYKVSRECSLKVLEFPGFSKSTKFQKVRESCGTLWKLEKPIQKVQRVIPSIQSALLSEGN